MAPPCPRHRDHAGCCLAGRSDVAAGLPGPPPRRDRARSFCQVFRRSGIAPNTDTTSGGCASRPGLTTPDTTGIRLPMHTRPASASG